jgi:FtsP/CotA-like multicopper oxidase with cupredoxin domain
MCPFCVRALVPSPTTHTPPGARWKSGMAHCHLAEHDESVMMFSFSVAP